MTTPELVPRRPFGGIVAVWIVAAVAGLVVAFVVPEPWRATWMTIALGGCLILAFSIQLVYGRPQRFIQRVALSTLGALLVLGVISAGLALASVTALIA